jgi:nanoRNase/pAp phosphatase (c-di-AMP/oligoRNAs hydrolase)
MKRTKEKLKKLQHVINSNHTILILMQNTPDPDAVASACALREVAHHLGDIHCTLAYGQTVGRAETRELIHYVGLHFHRFGEIEHQQFDLIALVDTQPGTGNNPLPIDIPTHIVIDHHPIHRVTRTVPFTDIRSHYGAASTILWEYLSEAQISIDIPLATALLYGIRSDTQDLERDTQEADIRAIESLYPLANKRMLGQIQRGQVPGDYYQILVTALTHTTIYGSCAISNLGEMSNPDMVGEVADLLLRHEKLDWTLCFGFYAGKTLLSLRTQDTKRRANEVVRRVVSRLGTGGGHASMAGGQIPLSSTRPTEIEKSNLEKKIRNRFLQALKIRCRRGFPLVHTNKLAHQKQNHD